MAGVKGRSGGARPGSGPKRRDPQAAWLSGAKKSGPRAIVPSSAPAVAQVVIKRPGGLELDVREVWDELAPYALEQGTLQPAFVMAFADLCALIVLERKLRASPLAACGPDHRGILQRVDTGRARFRLVPDGKPVVMEAPKDEWAEFDVIQGGKAG